MSGLCVFGIFLGVLGTGCACFLPYAPLEQVSFLRIIILVAL